MLVVFTNVSYAQYRKANQQNKIDPIKEIFLYDSFIGGIISNGSIGDLGWGYLASGTAAGAGSFSAADNNAIGIITLTSGTDLGGYSIIYLMKERLANTDETQRIGFRIRFENAGDVIMRIGFGDTQTNASPTNGAYFQLNTATTTNYQTISVASSASTISTTSESVDFDYHWLEIEMNKSMVKFYIDRNIVATHKTNIPTTQTQRYGIFFYVSNNAASTKKVYIDEFYYYVKIDKSINW